MKLDIKSKNNNVLLSRTEVDFVVEHSGESTPSRLDVRKYIAAKLGSKEELVVLKSLKTGFGSISSKGIAHVYKNEKDLKKIEPEYLIKRLEPKAKKEEPAEEAKPEEKPEESKEEEKTEEVPAEDKPVEEPKEETPAEEEKEEKSE